MTNEAHKAQPAPQHGQAKLDDRPLVKGAPIYHRFRAGSDIDGCSIDRVDLVALAAAKYEAPRMRLADFLPTFLSFSLDFSSILQRHLVPTILSNQNPACFKWDA